MIAAIAYKGRVMVLQLGWGPTSLDGVVKIFRSAFKTG
jgi:hypothetical protein